MIISPVYDDIDPLESRAVLEARMSIATTIDSCSTSLQTVFEGLYWRASGYVESSHLDTWPTLNRWQLTLFACEKELASLPKKIDGLYKEVAVQDAKTAPQLMKKLHLLEFRHYLLESECKEMLALVQKRDFRTALAWANKRIEDCTKQVARSDGPPHIAVQQDGELKSEIQRLFDDTQKLSQDGLRARMDSVSYNTSLLPSASTITLTGAYYIPEGQSWVKSPYYAWFGRYYKEVKALSPSFVALSKDALALVHEVKHSFSALFDQDGPFPSHLRTVHDTLVQRVQKLYDALFTIGFTDLHPARVHSLHGIRMTLKRAERGIVVIEQLAKGAAVLEVERLLFSHLPKMEIASFYLSCEKHAPLKELPVKTSHPFVDQLLARSIKVMDETIRKSGPRAFALTDSEKQVFTSIMAKKPLSGTVGLPEEVRSYILKRVTDLLFFPHDGKEELMSDRPYDLELVLTLFQLEHEEEYKIRFFNTLEQDATFARAYKMYKGVAIPPAQLHAACDILFHLSKAVSSQMKNSLMYAKTCQLFYDFCAASNEASIEVVDLIRLLYKKIEGVAQEQKSFPLYGVTLYRDRVALSPLTPLPDDPRALFFRALGWAAFGAHPDEKKTALNIILQCLQKEANKEANLGLHDESPDHQALVTFFKKKSLETTSLDTG